jgi:hypothetical protein
MAGCSRGTTTFQNAWNLEAPSMCAASSSCGGMLWRKLRRSLIAIGTVKVRKAMIRPG